MVRLDKEWEKIKREAKKKKNPYEGFAELMQDALDRGRIQKKDDGNLYLNGIQGDIRITKQIKDEDKKIKRKPIELPTNGILISDFADELVDTLKNKYELFFRRDIQEIVEITDDGFKIVKPQRFVTLAEKYFCPWQKIWKKNGESFEIDKSMSQQVAGTVLASPNFQDKIPHIKRIFPVPMPIIYEGKLTFPKRGYDKRFNSWMNFNAPSIKEDLSLEESKIILRQIYKEFCFQDEQDYVNAIAGLITPFLRGLYSSWNVRTPMFCYMANRERAGKDYCAGITGIVLEGIALEEPPISSGGFKEGSNNEELRKKIVSALLSGKKRLHFANNKGKLNSAVLEGFITSSVFSDRILGKNDTPTFDNEIEISLSGNIGMTFTPDLANRSRFVNLFLDIEDANSRKFNNPNLHQWVLENRELIISAIYSLIKNWINKGKPKGSINFSSFPEWAEICGGIMEAAGLGNPCKVDKRVSSGISLDEETDEMKQLFEYMIEINQIGWLKKSDLKRIIQNCDEPFFPYLDFTRKPDQTKFGLMIDKFVGRILSDIKLIVENPEIRASRRKYKFIKLEKNFEMKNGNVSSTGNEGLDQK